MSFDFLEQLRQFLTTFSDLTNLMLENSPNLSLIPNLSLVPTLQKHARHLKNFFKTSKPIKT